ncbi:MAG: glycosyltransferase [Candidatus Paceibacterota bacterium]|jgi:glycosyltransferase involved in cell wall biosynthesis
MDKDIDNQKLISVVIPAYNVAGYIKQSIFSVVSQTYKNLEIIIVNDGATDNTGEIIEEYAKKDNRIKIITQENKGLAAARNTGLSNAKGEYICILDSDDIMLPDKILQQYNFLELHPEYGICYSGAYHFIDGSKDIYYHPIKVLFDPQYESLLYGNIINPNTVFFRRSVFEKYGGFDESLRSAEDWDYWLTLAYNGVKFGYQPERLTLYRVRSSSLSSDYIMMSITPIRVLKKQSSRQISTKQKDIIESRITYWNKKLYISYLRSGKIDEAKAMENKINKNEIFFKLILLIPPWIFTFRYLIINKIQFPLHYKKVRDKNIENYLQVIEHYEKNQ